MPERSERVWTYLKPYDLEYLDGVRILLSGDPPKMSRGEALQFCLRENADGGNRR